MGSGAIRKITGAIVAGLRKGLIPFNHKVITTGHGFGSHLTIPVAGMVAIPFSGPNIICGLLSDILKFLNPGSLERSAVGTTVSLL